VKRPLSLTILAWFIIVTNVLTWLYMPFTLHNPLSMEMMARFRLPVWATLGSGLVLAVALLIAGIAMLKARVWGRNLYVAASVIGHGFTIFNMPFRAMLIPGLLIFILFLYILFRPAANAYFNQARG
jgi:hypothetical protein